jgi:hypothetical protein
VLSAQQRAAVFQSVVSDGPAAGCRAIDVRVIDGIDVRILPDRGCDIGAAWARGVPLAWTSAVGECGPRPGEWDGAWGGGLVTTCGRRNVGAASEGHAVHGDATHQRATITAVRRCEVDGELAVVVEATLREATALGACLETQRTISTWAGESRVLVADRTRNLGPEPQAAPLLYHVNLGAPLWAPGATLAFADHESVLPRDADAAVAVGDWDRAPAFDETPERVFEHALRPAPEGVARVQQPALGLAVEVRWDRAGLPRAHQWLHTANGAYVLGIEPANCSVLGRAADRAAGTLPFLAPGEERETWVEISALWSRQTAAGGSTSNSTSSA